MVARKIPNLAIDLGLDTAPRDSSAEIRLQTAIEGLSQAVAASGQGVGQGQAVGGAEAQPATSTFATPSLVNLPVEQQIKQGFLRAGRQDLADMVDTPEFSTWINQESGWTPDVESPANNQGKSNYGLFQLWRGHDWLPQGYNPDPTEQAYLAATKFNLTPDRIKRFANEILTGSYEGWG